MASTIRRGLHFSQTSIYSIQPGIQKLEIITEKAETTIDMGRRVLCSVKMIINDSKYFIKTVTNGLNLTIDEINIIVDHLSTILNHIIITIDCIKYLIYFVKIFVNNKYNIHQ